MEGNFKRSLNQRSEKSSFYVEMLDYDKDNLICYDKFNFEVPFLLVSKQDGSITKSRFHIKRSNYSISLKDFMIKEKQEQLDQVRITV